jgi:hypothetical protein
LPKGAPTSMDYLSQNIGTHSHWQVALSQGELLYHCLLIKAKAKGIMVAIVAGTKTE